MTEPAAAAPRQTRNVLLLLGASTIAGLSGYLVTAMASHGRSPAEYQQFGAFWSALYFIIGALSGIQNAVARAAHPAPESPGPDRPRLGLFCFWSVGGAAVVVTALAIPVGVRVFEQSSAAYIGTLVLAATSYAAMAILGGLFFGLGLVKYAAFSITLDAALRCALAGTAIALAATLPVLALAVTAPFLLAVLVTYAVSRRRLRGSFRIDVPVRELLRQSAVTVLGATASGALLSGVPLILGFITTDGNRAEVGALTLVLLLTRSPIVLPLMALQTFLVTRFKEGIWRLRTLLVWGLIAGIGLSLLAAVVGPPLLEAVFGSQYVLGPVVTGSLVFGSALAALMYVAGPAAIAAERHSAFAAGWIAAALVTAAVILVPWGSAAVSCATGLIAGPIVGLLVQLRWRR